MLSIGIFRLVLYWKPNWLLYCTHSKCLKLCDSSKVLLKDKYEQYFVEEIKTIQSNREADFTLVAEKNANKMNEIVEIKYFMNKKWRYIFDQSRDNFFRLK